MMLLLGLLVSALVVLRIDRENKMQLLAKKTSDFVLAERLKAEQLMASALSETRKAEKLAASANETLNIAKKIENSLLRERLITSKVMLCAILKNEQLYIDEWLEYHRYLGFDYAHLYDNAANASSYLASLPEKYGSFVRVTHLPGTGKQQIAYKTCIQDLASNNTWGAFIDIDEFIVLRQHGNIKAFLHDVAPNGGSVVLGWSIMGSNSTSTRKNRPVVARFTLTTKVPDQHIKTIAYLGHAHYPFIHNVLMHPGHPTVDQHGRAVNHTSPFVFGNDRRVAYINHYYTKSWEEFVLKRQRGYASNVHRNHLVTNGSPEALTVIMDDFVVHNKNADAARDTFARDFYVRNHALVAEQQRPSL